MPVSVSGLVPGLVKVKVSEVVPFKGTTLAPKALATVGGPSTLRLAVLLVPPVPPSVEVTAPVVLFCVPVAIPVTLTTILQAEEGAKVPPDRLIRFVPCVAVTVPPQLLVSPLGVETISPAGKLSLKEMPVSVVVALIVLSEKVSEVVPFSGMLAAPKVLVRTGG